MSDQKPPAAIPRTIPVGTIPLIAVEGSAYDCGRHYAEIVLAQYPGFREYLDMAYHWSDLPPVERQLVEKRAPHLLDLHRGLLDVTGPPAAPGKASQEAGCTSFGVSGSVTLDGQPISGQTKDTSLDRVPRYIVLRMRIKDAPNMLVLAYPGEVLGYGMWSTGMTIFRNSLFSRAGSPQGLSFPLFGLIALASHSVEEVSELALQYGFKGAGNAFFSDASGKSISVEANVGGVSVLEQVDGILTHANHPEGDQTAPYEAYPFEGAKADSQYRMHGLHKLLEAERGRLTPQKALMLLADHTLYPGGTCKHASQDGAQTTAVVIAEPTLGKLHVVRGQPCCNWPVTYTL